MEKYRNIFLVGIKGVGMANIAILLSEMGKHVLGSDTSEEFITDVVLKNKNIHVIQSLDAKELLPDVDLVVYSGSHGGSENPQVKEAVKRNIEVLSQSQFLGEIMGEFKTSIAVCGTHGKTNTAGLLAFMLMKLNKNTSYVVGTSSFNDVAGGHYGSKDFLVLEADEYATDPPRDSTPKFHHLNPSYILCTSIGFDHPDVFKDIEHTKEEFLKFFKKVSKSDKKLILCADDDNIMAITKQLPEKSYVLYGFSPYSNYMISNIVEVNDLTLFDVTKDGSSVGSFSTKLAGDKIIGNVTGVIALLSELGFDAETIHDYLPEFVGAKRRFEKVATIGDIDVYDDYAHHPHEIEATIEAARKRFPHRKIITIFQPHTFSRTESLQNEFVESLSQSDVSFISPIFASAREDKSKFTITSDKLAQLASQNGLKNVLSYASKEELFQKLRASIEPGSVIFTMGAGDVYKLKDDIISILNSR